MRQDIKHVFSQALKKANQSIFLSIYGITDPDILHLLHKKSIEGIPIHIEYDPSASSNLKKVLGPPAELNPIKSKGLMHRKILILDSAQIFLGSANLTPPSLRHHDNFVIGIHSPPLAQFLTHPTSTHFELPLKDQTANLYLLPDSKQLGISVLNTYLQAAKKSISVAMFTLTHPELCKALIEAHKRGVDVEVAVDYYSGRGASKKAVDELKKEGVKVRLSQGQQLLHHKWALIDSNCFIVGSANWTKSAFTKNQDFLLFLTPLTNPQKKYLNSLWEIIVLESSLY